ncbi:MAG: IclR family transcriptional regulator [Burkholderiaceae bacterium]
MDETTGKASGAQSASRALALLKLVGNHHPQGVRLKDLIAETGQDRSTVHRLLTCLVDEGFLERTAPSKSYRLGMEAMQLGLMSAAMVPVVDRFRPVMQRLARQTGDTVFLIVRSGDHALCLHREEGPYPVKAFVIEPGSRRLLGVSSVGMCILSRLPEAEVLAHYQRHEPQYLRLRMTADKLLRATSETRRKGYSEAQDFRTDDTNGVGCSFRLSRNTYAGISIAAIHSRMPPERRHEVAGQLIHEAIALDWHAEAPAQ